MIERLSEGRHGEVDDFAGAITAELAGAMVGVGLQKLAGDEVMGLIRRKFARLQLIPGKIHIAEIGAEGVLVRRLFLDSGIGDFGVGAFAEGHVLNFPRGMGEEADDVALTETFEEEVGLDDPGDAARAKGVGGDVQVVDDGGALAIDGRVVAAQVLVGDDGVDAAALLGPLGWVDVFALED